MRSISILVCLSLAACSQDSGNATKETRSDVVTGTASVNSKPAPTAAASAEPRSGKLCSASNRVEASSQAGDPGPVRRLPKVKFGRIESSSTTIGEGTLETGGTWTWINLWAGWCGPCRAEVPLLLQLRDRLGKDGAPARITFVSVDDDDREARKFVGESGMKETLYLPEGKDRTKFLEGLGSNAATSLPIQVFVDPQGSIRCVAHGEITEADYAEIAAMFAKK